MSASIPAVLGLVASGLSARAPFDPAAVSPGLLGFIPVFLIALATIGLGLSLTSKLRKVNRRQALLDAAEAAEAKAAAEIAAQAAPGAPSRAPGGTVANPAETPPADPAGP